MSCCSYELSYDNDKEMIELLHGYADYLCFFCSSGFGVMTILDYCLLEACLHAGSAVDTFKCIIANLPGFQINFYSISRAYPGAITTQVALIAVKSDAASGFRKRLP